MARGHIFHIGLALATSLVMMGSGRSGDFYDGKTVTIVVGFTPGGTYDQIARLYARHLGRFLPGRPTILVQNMPGAGSMVAAANLFNTARRDGTTLGIVGGAVVWEPILGNLQARYDSRKFNWIGGLSRDNITCLVWHTVPVNTINDALNRETVVGATGPGSRTMMFPKALNELLGTKLKIVSGYPGGNEITMALEKGEVEGYCGWALGSLRQRAADWYRDKKIKFLVQFAQSRDKDLPQVPLATDLPKTQIGLKVMEFMTSDAILAWTLLTPPEVPAERLVDLRRAYTAMIDDPQFRAEAEREKLEIDPVSGNDLHELVERLATTPADVIDVIKRIREGK
jgi:tripartite-type tricarboxylate transporter receptor subunit TctC